MLNLVKVTIVINSSDVGVRPKIEGIRLPQSYRTVSLDCASIEFIRGNSIHLHDHKPLHFEVYHILKLVIERQNNIHLLHFEGFFRLFIPQSDIILVQNPISIVVEGNGLDIWRRHLVLEVISDRFQG